MWQLIIVHYSVLFGLIQLALLVVCFESKAQELVYLWQIY